MSKRTVEIDDTLPDRVQSAIDDVKQELLNYLEQNPDTDELPCISNDLDYSGAIHGIIDGSVPIYTKEINDTWYLYGDECEQAFDDAGIGDKDDDKWPMGWKAAAIYCYIEQEVHEWYHNNAKDIFEEWQAKKEPKAPLTSLPHCPRCKGETELNGTGGFVCFFCGHEFTEVKAKA